MLFSNIATGREAEIYEVQKLRSKLILKESRLLFVVQKLSFSTLKKTILSMLVLL